MGAFNCFNSSVSKGEILTLDDKNKEIVNVFRTNKKLMMTLHRIQARLRGLIIRNKVRSAGGKRNFAGRDNYGNYHYTTTSQIVIKFNYFS